MNAHRRPSAPNPAKPRSRSVAPGLLSRGAMRMRFLLMVMLVAVPAAAHADGYFFNEGLGPGATVGGEMGQRFDGEGLSLRVSLGRRVNNWAVEGVLFGSNLNEEGSTGNFAQPQFMALSYGVDFRYYIPLGPNLEAYAKAGLHGTSITTTALADDPSGLADYGGRGYDVGGGISWFVRPFKALGSSSFRFNPFARLKVGLFADLTMQTVRLNKDRAPSLDGDLRMWTFGFGIGSDL